MLPIVIGFFTSIITTEMYMMYRRKKDKKDYDEIQKEINTALINRFYTYYKHLKNACLLVLEIGYQHL